MDVFGVPANMADCALHTQAETTHAHASLGISAITVKVKIFKSHYNMFP